MPQEQDSAQRLVFQEEIGRRLVELYSEDELPFYEEIIRANSRTEEPKEHTLGFGVQDLSDIILSTGLYAIAGNIINFIWSNGKDSAGSLIKETSEEIKKHVVAQLKERLSGSSKNAAIAGISESGINSLIEQISSNAAFAKMDKNDRQKLLDSIRGFAR